MTCRQEGQDKHLFSQKYGYFEMRCKVPFFVIKISYFDVDLAGSFEIIFISVVMYGMIYHIVFGFAEIGKWRFKYVYLRAVHACIEMFGRSLIVVLVSKVITLTVILLISSFCIVGCAEKEPFELDISQMKLTFEDNFDGARSRLQCSHLLFIPSLLIVGKSSVRRHLLAVFVPYLWKSRRRMVASHQRRGKASQPRSRQRRVV